ncbi:unnamed protein product [Rotaria sp. Silwood1]|nr:unnamed protein product [Rotaria sp. Silwood1]
MSIAIIVFLLTFLYIPNNATDRTTDSIIYDNRVHAFLRKLTRQNENRSNPAIQGCSFFGYDFSFLNQNNGTDYVGTDVGVITNTYKMNICGPVNDNRCQYSWRIPTSVCYICTRGNPHCLGSVTLIGSFGADGAGVAWNFIDPRKPGLVNTSILYVLFDEAINSQFEDDAFQIFNYILLLENHHQPKVLRNYSSNKYLIREDIIFALENAVSISEFSNQVLKIFENMIYNNTNH